MEDRVLHPRSCVAEAPNIESLMFCAAILCCSPSRARLSSRVFSDPGMVYYYIVDAVRTRTW